MIKDSKIKFGVIIIILVIVVGLIISVFLNAPFCRWVKSTKSELSGGLNRTVTVYDYNGKEIKHWSGKIDVQTSNRNNKVLFDVNGKRVIIQGGIVINEEN